MKERISNILAWFGFFFLVLFVLMIIPGSSWYGGSSVPAPGRFLLIYGFFAVLNYAVSGRYRLLPWIKK